MGWSGGWQRGSQEGWRWGLMGNNELNVPPCRPHGGQSTPSVHNLSGIIVCLSVCMCVHSSGLALLLSGSWRWRGSPERVEDPRCQTRIWRDLPVAVSGETLELQSFTALSRWGRWTELVPHGFWHDLIIWAKLATRAWNTLPLQKVAVLIQ